MRVYKGDLIQRVTVDNVDITNCWAREVIGVRTTADIHPDAFWLYHRPLKNYFWQLLDWFLN